MASVVLMFLAIVVVWILTALIPRRTLPQERGLKPQYQTICAGIQKSRLGFLGMASPFPFWRLSLYKPFAVIAVSFPIVVDYSDFDSIKSSNFLLFKSVQFRSKQHGINFSAWVLSSQPMINILLEHGIPVLGYKGSNTTVDREIE